MRLDGPCLILAGPLTRNRIKLLMDPLKQSAALSAPEATPAVHEERRTEGKFQVQRPALPPEIPQYFLPVRGRQPSGGSLIYLPAVFGEAEVRFSDIKGVESMRIVPDSHSRGGCGNPCELGRRGGLPDWQGGISNPLQWPMLNSANSRPWRARRRTMRGGAKSFLLGCIELRHSKPTTALA